MVNAAHLTAIMLRGRDGPEGLTHILKDPRFNALRWARLWASMPYLGGWWPWPSAQRGLVLDADALTSFEGLASTVTKRFRHAPTVLTPMRASLRACSATTIPRSAVESRARAASRGLSGAAVLLKGADTVIAAPDGRAAINENGTPYLGTAGRAIPCAASSPA